MICDPLLKLLVIPLHHVIEYIYIKFCPEYIYDTYRKGLACQLRIKIKVKA